jgi:predicted enzyme related to lactoylglutathione lyase
VKPAEWPRSLWFYFFNVTDIEAAAKRVTSRGGSIIYGPAAVAGGARIVHCRDAQKVPFALVDTRVNVTVGCYSPRNRAGEQKP